jgi:transcriptional regulator with XRE-family HTH domain
MPESRVARADRRADGMRRRTGAELRDARLAAGLSLLEAARAAGISKSEASRIERGQAAWVDLSTLARMAAVSGLDLWVRTYPGGEPLHDSGHLGLADAFLPLVAEPLVVRSEVPIGDPRDLRAWDLTLTDPAQRGCGVELETRLTDAQAQHRRITRKLDDSGLEQVLLVVADTRANRSAVRAAAGMLRTTYAIDDPAVINALREGHLPARSALIFVRVPARQRRPAQREQKTEGAAETSPRAAPRDEPTTRPKPREWT